MKTVHTVIGKYERDEMKPSITVAEKLAKHLDTTVGAFAWGNGHYGCIERSGYD